MLKTAINITTSEWYNIIAELKNDGWNVRREYGGFDAGIDFDSCVLVKNGKRISFMWDNWTEGEITCSDEICEELSQKFSITFEYITP
jgi:hypothetical protein